MSDASGVSLSMARALRLLSDGEIEIQQQLPWSSNYTFLVRVADPETSAYAVYKPKRGERPLWDFESGTLCHRETAAFVVSQELGWEIVPPTVLRDGPYGVGALQLFVPHDPENHYLVLDDPDLDVVRRIAAFDVVINNADRKSGHVLVAEDGELWAIDHGISFHAEPKLRTVIWDLAGTPLPSDVSRDVARLADALEDPGAGVLLALSELVSKPEVDAISARSRELVAAGRYPIADETGPAIPWPPV